MKNACERYIDGENSYGHEREVVVMVAYISVVLVVVMEKGEENEYRNSIEGILFWIITGISV